MRYKPLYPQICGDPVGVWKICQKEDWVVVHKNGFVGRITQVYGGDGRVFIMWDGWNPYGDQTPIEYSYNIKTAVMTVYECKYNDYIKQAQGGAQQMTALYEMTDKDGNVKFATKIAEKSATQWIVEIKGTNDYVAVNVADLKEVLPYTVRVVYLGGDGVNDLEAEEGKYAVGEVYLLNNNKVAAIVALDTGKRGCPAIKPVAKFNMTVL